MDIIKELNKLPNYGYVVFRDGKDRVAILGGHSCQKITNVLSVQALFDLNDRMQEVYEKTQLSDEDKIFLAKSMKKMMDLCNGRLEGNYTLENQEEYILGLPEESQKGIVKQIEMYKACRKYFREFGL